MRQKVLWLALVALAVWIYAIGGSARELLTLLAAVAPEPSVTVEAQGEPAVAPPARLAEERLVAGAPPITATELPASAPAPVAPRAGEPVPASGPAPAVYAAAEAAETLDHPHITDPDLREKLRLAWDD
jgi:hypothetical protein